MRPTLAAYRDHPYFSGRILWSVTQLRLVNTFWNGLEEVRAIRTSHSLSARRKALALSDALETMPLRIKVSEFIGALVPDAEQEVRASHTTRFIQIKHWITTYEDRLKLEQLVTGSSRAMRIERMVLEVLTLIPYSRLSDPRHHAPLTFDYGFSVALARHWMEGTSARVSFPQ